MESREKSRKNQERIKKGKMVMQKRKEKLVRTIVLRFGRRMGSDKEWSGGRASDRSKASSPTGPGVKMETGPQKHTTA